VVTLFKVSRRVAASNCVLLRLIKLEGSHCAVTRAVITHIPLFIHGILTHIPLFIIMVYSQTERGKTYPASTPGLSRPRTRGLRIKKSRWQKKNYKVSK
jgi:hypothetical protein